MGLLSNNKIMKFRNLSLGTQTIFLLVAFCLLATSADAQSSRKKRTTAKNTPVVQPTPYSRTEPEIISRAEDYSTEPSVLPSVVETAARTLEQHEKAETAKTIEELRERVKNLETEKKEDYDLKQKRLSMNLEILIKAEQRAESLRKQAFEMLEKENTIKTRLDQLENDLRPESVDRSVAFAGSLRPEDLRAARKKSLEAERANLQNLLNELQRTRSNLDLNVQKSDALVERLRVKLEAEIDAALDEKPSKP